MGWVSTRASTSNTPSSVATIETAERTKTSKSCLTPRLSERIHGETSAERLWYEPGVEDPDSRVRTNATSCMIPPGSRGTRRLPLQHGADLVVAARTNT